MVGTKLRADLPQMQPKAAANAIRVRQLKWRHFVRPGPARSGQQAFPDRKKIFPHGALGEVFGQAAGVVPVNTHQLPPELPPVAGHDPLAPAQLEHATRSSRRGRDGTWFSGCVARAFTLPGGGAGRPHGQIVPVGPGQVFGGLVKLVHCPDVLRHDLRGWAGGQKVKARIDHIRGNPGFRKPVFPLEPVP